MMKVAAAAAALLVLAVPAIAEDGDLPAVCESAFVVATLGTVTNMCKTMRVTGAGMKLVQTMQAQKAPSDCPANAKSKVTLDLMTMIAQAKGDMDEGTRQWCNAAPAAFEMTFPGITVVEGR